MECDDAELLLAARGLRTLTDMESTQLGSHAAGCPACRELAASADGDERSRWVVRVPEDALDDPDLLVLPTVDPIVFASERELARGGMGRITRVRDRRLGRTVAIKEVLDPAMRARFEREVAITAQLQHPAIVPVYEAGEWPDGSAFYTMRLVSGGTLAEAIAKTTTLEQRLALLPHVLALTDALAYAHSRGIVHRDLKPGNVLVGEFGETVVIDWGLAKELRRKIDDPVLAAATPSALTMAGAVLGTPGFMAPEQAAGHVVDERADVYALGAILYNVLAGEMPFQGRAGGEILELVALGRAPAPIASRAPRAPADLVTIVERAMAIAPTDRYPTAREMAEELRRFQAGQLLRSREYSLRELIARWIRRHRAAVAIGALAVVAITAIGIGALIRVARSNASEQATLTSLLAEQGRARLLDGDREQALAYLTDAYARGGDTVALRHMLTEATRDTNLLAASLPTRGVIAANLSYAPDGTIVTLSDPEHPVAVTWRDGRAIRTIETGVGLSWSRLTRDGRRAALVEPDGAIGVFDTATGAKLWDAHDDHGAATVIDTDPTSRILAAMYIRGDTAFGTLQLRELDTGAVLATMAGASDEVAFTDDGTLVASCLKDALAVWRTRTGELVKSLPKCDGAFGFLGTDRVVMQTSDEQVQILALDDRPPITLSGTHAFTHLAIDARSERIAISDISGEVSLWTTLGEHLGTAHANVRLFAFSPDGALLAGGGGDRRIYIWDASTLEQVASVSGPDEAADHTAEGLAWSPDGQLLATSRLADTHAFVYHRPRGHRVLDAIANTSGVARGVLATTLNREIQLRDPLTGAVTRRIAVPIQPDDVPLQLDRAGTRLLSSNTRNNGARVIDLATGAALIVREAPSTDADHQLDYALSADGTRLLETSRAHAPAAIRVLDVATGAVVRELEVSGDLVEASISPDGARIAIVGNGFTARVIDVASGASHDIADQRHLLFDPTGTRVLAFGPGQPKLFDARTGAELLAFPELPVSLDAARFSASGTRLAVWASDRTAHVWDTLTGKQLFSVDGVAWGAIALTDDGARLATGNEDGTVRIWDTSSGVLLENLRAPFPIAPRLEWLAAGTRLLAQGTTYNRIALWDVHLEMRSPAEITAAGRRD